MRSISDTIFAIVMVGVFLALFWAISPLSQDPAPTSKVPASTLTE